MKTYWQLQDQINGLVADGWADDSETDFGILAALGGDALENVQSGEYRFVRANQNGAPNTTTDFKCWAKSYHDVVC